MVKKTPQKSQKLHYWNKAVDKNYDCEVILYHFIYFTFNSP